ncbi:hypothetical protein KKR91_03640 [Arthrobacter jiangjiafuii]|uniref:site-specific DNA-methyltransferase (adenine-specific) n=1 Tax=Arthrobacter jiangjiafuii TaxID=2817475 RepID=A0A975R1R0_9MICC|nr:hypothetical protein [Arthrobacter jiangjiafuii]QWC10729.1 hypothetical protein KKR91_03640 [Arthrobacter jiangjiafuii]
MSHESKLESFLSDFNGRMWSQSGAPDYVHARAFYQALDGVRLDVVYAVATHRPLAADLRAMWEKRWNRRPTGVLLVVGYLGQDASPRAAIVGLRDTAQLATDMPLSLVERIVEQGLEAPTTALAEQLIAPLFASHDDDEILGLVNTGLFATHELLANVPHRSDWTMAKERSQAFRWHSGEDLVRALGWDVSRRGADLILGKNGREDAVAVLLEGSELFDRPSSRFGETSPVQHGISLARNTKIRWVLAVQGTRIRLYTADPDVGISRKGSDTYTEIDLAIIDDEHLAYAALLITPEALCAQGTADTILAASQDHAAGLGERLRERIYVDVVPDLATAVAARFGAATETELRSAYRATLIILFRLLFVAYAEDRGLLPYKTNERYTHVSLKERARSYAKNLQNNEHLSFDPQATDLWDNLLGIWRGIFSGHTEWGIPAYGGSLFDPAETTGTTIDALRLTNSEIGPALVKLLVDTGRDSTMGPVDFQTLSVREFGTIYEGLLESSLSVAPVDLAVNADGVYVPAAATHDVVIHAGEVYFHNASGMRKTTGSYFTKQFAVEHLLETALDPAVEEHLGRVAGLIAAGDEVSAHDIFWDFRVADISMGSGHFLVGAVDHIASSFSAFLAEHPLPGVARELDQLRATALAKLADTGAGDLPEIDQMTLVRRQVAKRCIYGIDLNGIAVDLARLALWIHTFVPGLPMSSLDHGLVQGDSLTGIGTLDEAFDVLEPNRMGMRSLLADRLEQILEESAETLRRVGLTAEASASEAKGVEEAYAEALKDSEPAKAILDAAVAHRLGLINLDGVLDTDLILQSGRRDDVRQKVERLGCVHLAFAFPEVFISRNGNPAGFHVILGNPPWDEVMVEEPKFWQRFFPGVMGMSPAAQKKAIKQYRADRPDLVALHQEEEEAARMYRQTLLAGPYPGLGTGDVDLYKAFSWRFWQLLREGGRFGVVFPRSVLNAAGSARWRSTVLAQGTFDSVVTLTNTGKWVFDEVDGRYSVTLLTVKKTASPEGEVRLAGPFHSLRDFMAGRQVLGSLPASGLAEWTSGASFPLLPDTAAIEAFRALRFHPRLDSGEQWLFKPVAEFHATSDRPTFDAGEAAPGRWPVFTGATFNLWNPDAGDPYTFADPDIVTRALFEKRKRQARLRSSGFLGLDPKIVGDIDTLPCYHPRIAFRDIARSTDSRTAIAALVPGNVVLTNKAPYLLRRSGDPTDEAYLLGVLSSIPLDWYTRRYVEIGMNLHIVNALPIPRPERNDPRRLRVVEIAAKLAAVDERYASWAAAVGVPVGSVTHETTKTDLIHELDAAVASLYGLSRASLIHIFETFHRGWDYRPRLAGVLTHFDRWSQA